jgi:uncharacterized protein YutE (UPF0331/DUF86 family)
VLSTELRAAMKGLGGFRNVLVHDYLGIDPERVREGLVKAPEHFERFAGEVHRWLATRPE